MDFVILVDHIVKKKKKSKYLDLARKLKRTLKYEGDSNTNHSALEMIPKGLEKRLEELEIRGRIKTIQTAVVLRSTRTLKSPGDLRRLAVTQTPVKDYQLMLV